MATVFLARDLKHDRRVAVKVLHPELSASLGSERFLREIRIAAQLTHPHILPVHDSGESDGVLFYVMPFVEGESLRDLLTRTKQLPLDQALRIAREIADALNCAHRTGVIHRDIKPENILLEADHAVVADFGIARAVGVAGAERLTGTGLAVGTPAYMSPEQAAGGDVDPRSDLYSLACVLYEMLAGQPPFIDLLASAVLVKQATQVPAPLLAQRPDAPRELALATHTLLSKNPASRPRTAAEARAMLERSVAPRARPAVDTAPFASTVQSAAAPRLTFVRAAAACAIVAMLGAAVLVWANRTGAGARAANVPPWGSVAAAATAPSSPPRERANAPAPSKNPAAREETRPFVPAALQPAAQHADPPPQLAGGVPLGLPFQVAEDERRPVLLGQAGDFLVEHLSTDLDFPDERISRHLKRERHYRAGGTGRQPGLELNVSPRP
jgi:serine/threonine-protein kinase